MGILYDAAVDLFGEDEVRGLLDDLPEKGYLTEWLQEKMPNPPGTYRGAILPFTNDGKERDWAVPGMVRDSAIGLAEWLDASASPEKGAKAYSEGLSGDAYLSLPMLGAPQVAATAMGKVPKGALGIFGGPGAKTANKSALKAAREMAESGAGKKEIWDATGWFEGVDGKWRFEIDDSGAQLTPKAADELMSGGGGTYGATQRTASGTISHPEMYDAYPELRGAHVDARHNVDLQSPRGSFSQPPNRGGASLVEIQSNSLEGAPNSVKGIGLHEMQHGIQGSEGFARGGSPEGMARDFAIKRARISALENEVGDSVLEQQARIMDDWVAGRMTDAEAAAAEKALTEKFPALGEMQRLAAELGGRGGDMTDNYRRLAGETEARNVQNRMNMTMDERRATPPWETEDVPAADQIVRFDGGQMNSELPMDEASRMADRTLLRMTDEEAAKISPAERLDIAQRNAAVPVEQGGLGLPVDNTPDMRARALGFDTDAFHATNSTFNAFDPLMRGSKTDSGWFGDADYFSPDPEYTHSFIRGDEANIIPARLRLGNSYDWRREEGFGLSQNNREHSLLKRKEMTDKGFDSVTVDNVRVRLPDGEHLTDEQLSMLPYADALGRESIETSLNRGYDYDIFRQNYGADVTDAMPIERTPVEYAIFDPKNIRSRFAAFDPARRDSADLLAANPEMGALFGLLYGHDQNNSPIGSL